MPAISVPLIPVTTPRSGVTSGAAPGKQRLLGVDLARGLALVGMMAVHTLPDFNSDGTPTVTTIVAHGRAAAVFVLIAGVGLAFISGGQAPVQGRERIAVSAGLAVRAVLIGALGLALGLLSPFLHDISVILSYYGLLFLLAIPLLGLAPLALAGIAAAAIVLGPVLLLVTADSGLPSPDGDPTLASLVHDPLGLLVQLCVTGGYPLVVFIAYLCAGLAIGRLNLTSRRVAWWLLGAGAALAVIARVASLILLYPLGGLANLTSQTGSVDAVQWLWDPQETTSWWYLALPAPQSYTPVDLAHTLGSAIAVLGAALLLTRVPALARLLRPLAIAGSMVLTLYSVHLVVLATGVLADRPELLFLLMVIAAIAFALLWRRWFDHGPLERLVALASTGARRMTTRLLAERPPTTADTKVKPRPVPPKVIRGIGQLLGPLAIAGVLALLFWAGARSVAPTANPQEPAAAANLTRYCTLSAQLDDLDTQFPGQPKRILDRAAPQLTEMTQVAPVELREAVTTRIANIRAQGGVPAVAGPDAATLQTAKTAIDAFEDENC